MKDGQTTIDRIGKTGTKGVLNGQGPVFLIFQEGRRPALNQGKPGYEEYLRKEAIPGVKYSTNGGRDQLLVLHFGNSGFWIELFHNFWQAIRAELCIIRERARS